MPEGLLLLPLLGGFAFLHLAHLFRFKAQRWDGYRLVLASACVGVILLLLGRCMVLLFGLIPKVGPWAGDVWHYIVPFAHSDTCAWAFVLGPGLAMLGVNRMYGIEEAKNKQIEEDKRADAFTRLLHVGARDNRLISVTLESRKWYVGFVAEAPNLNPEEKYFRLLPMMSGYRNKDTLETFRTVFYQDVLEAVDSSDFVITMAIVDVKTANFFDPDVYDAHFAEDEEEVDESPHIDDTGESA
jgi:hypothetical protein